MAVRYYVKRSDVTGNPFEWLLGETILYKTPHPYFIVSASSVKTLEVKTIEFHVILTCTPSSQVVFSTMQYKQSISNFIYMCLLLLLTSL